MPVAIPFLTTTLRQTVRSICPLWHEMSCYGEEQALHRLCLPILCSKSLISGVVVPLGGSQCHQKCRNRPARRQLALSYLETHKGKSDASDGREMALIGSIDVKKMEKLFLRRQDRRYVRLIYGSRRMMNPVTFENDPPAYAANTQFLRSKAISIYITL